MRRKNFTKKPIKIMVKGYKANRHNVTVLRVNIVKRLND